MPAHVALTCASAARSPSLTVVDRGYCSIPARGWHASGTSELPWGGMLTPNITCAPEVLYERFDLMR